MYKDIAVGNNQSTPVCVWGIGEIKHRRGIGHISGRKIKLLKLETRFKEEPILNYLCFFL